MRAALVRSNIVGIGVHRFLVAVVVLHGHLYNAHALVSLKMQRLLRRHLLSLVKVCHKLPYAALIVEYILLEIVRMLILAMIFMPLFKNASSRRRCLMVSKLNTVVSNISESGRNL